MEETALARVRCKAATIRLPQWQILFTSCQLSVVVLAFVLRTYHLGRLSLWYDEGVSWTFARLPLGQLLQTVEDRDLNPPLYPILLHFWIIVASSRAYALRFLSVIPGTLTVALTMALARRGFRQPVVVVLAGIFSGTSIFLIDYSQEARAYALATWFVLLATYALVPSSAQPERQWWVVYALALALALYSHYATVVFCTVHGVWMVITAWRKMKPYVVSSMVTALLFLPWLGAFLHQLAVVRAGPNIFWSGSISPFLAPGRALAAVWSRPGAFTDKDRQLIVTTAVVIGLL
ncbi:MAG: glycosyltransferase family 39 protein, partial [Chloroflexi bacterium]|nr:glycosyltransferase family 39 protein [Chloroflexota bacterium]